ncbi:peptidoglycan editing factor PgeF [bacterium]|nr:MAG: peptidoglycan editing factor PgeF [bacterium]
MSISSGYPRRYFLFDSFKKYNCLAAFNCDRRDLGFQHNTAIKENRANFLKKIKVNPLNLICLQQVHSNRVYLAEKKDRGSGASSYASAIAGYDGIATRDRSLPLAILTADCLPVFLLDVKNMAAALVHCGWRGTRDGIAQAALDMLKNKFKSRAKDILCGLGPSIRSCCYQVGPEFSDYFSDGLAKRKGKIFFDLAGANLKQLHAAGILKKNITDSAICTFCRNKYFFSYRKEGGRAGRMMSVIMIK